MTQNLELDSQFEVRLAAENGGTRGFFRHWDLPVDSSEAYGQGWRDYNVDPMGRYFA